MAYVINLKKVLKDLQCDLYLIQKINCSKEDSKKYLQLIKQGQSLPDGVFEGNEYGQFYTIYNPEELTAEERLEYIMLMQYKNVNTIKKCVLFFTVLMIISLIVYIMILMSNL